MKQIIILVLIAFVLAMPAILAEENSSVNASSEEVPVLISAPVSDINDSESDLNENESVSAWSIGWKQVGIWFTFNQEKKVEKELELAKLRLIQAKIAARNNDSVAMQAALDAHEALIERIKERVSKMDLNKSRGLDRAIEVHEARITKLNYALANANLTDDQRENIQERISKIENVTSHLRNVEADIEENKERIRERLNSSEDNGEEIRERIESKNSSLNTTGNQVRERVESEKDKDSN